MRSFLIRSLVAVIAIPALLWIFHQGGWWLRGLVTALIVIGSHEAWRMARAKGAGFPLLVAVVITLLIPGLLFRNGPSWPLWSVATIVGSAFPAIWRRDPERAALGAAAQIVATIWLGLGFGAWIILRELNPDSGFQWLVFLFANLWIGDTAAYLFGTWLGGARLSPAISPKKTVAGGVAQVAVSAVIGLAYARGGWIDASPALLVTAAVMIAVVGQVGDLFESIWKRTAGVKDSSGLIPGHGGVLDRFDSALFAAPALVALFGLWDTLGLPWAR
jgi:phosphatidate cytidylyltransferase